MSDLQRVLDVMMRATLTELQLCSHVPKSTFRQVPPGPPPTSSGGTTFVA